MIFISSAAEKCVSRSVCAEPPSHPDTSTAADAEGQEQPEEAKGAPALSEGGEEL